MRKSFLSVSGQSLIGIPLALLASIVLARTLEVEEFGSFSFIISLATILAVPVSAGLPLLLTRETAAYSQSESWGSLKGILAAALGWVIASSILMGVAFLGWSFFADGEQVEGLFVAFVMLPVLGLGAIRTGVLRGLGHPVLSLMPPQILHPAILLLGYTVLYLMGHSNGLNALYVYLVAATVALFLSSIFVRHVQPVELQTAELNFSDFYRWRRAIFPFMLISGVTILSTQSALLLLGFMGMETALAEMRVADRAAQLVILPLALIEMVIGPYFVQALKSGSHEDLRQVSRQSARIALAVALPAAVFLVFFGQTVLLWTFGPPYNQQSYLPLMVLISSQVIAVALGNGGILLAMAGHERQTLLSLIVSVVVIGALGGLLIGPFNATGAAIAVGAGLVSSKAYIFFAVKRRLGIYPGVI